LQQAPSLEEIENNFTHVMPGGRFKPKECLARHRVAILVPYRNREKQLNVFLHNMHQFLPRQQIDYGIFVIEQVGFVTTLLFFLLLHCVFPVSTAVCIVMCKSKIVFRAGSAYQRNGMSARVFCACASVFFKLPYYGYFGGVSVLSKKHMEFVNGFSNLYWGWGGEDDDMFNRLQHSNLDITRYPAEIARYTMLGHVKETPSPERFRLLSGARSRYRRDGLNSVKYERKKLVLKKLYTWILVDLKAP
ncbi:beta-1,4-galactosyltransferase, putative, partial [Ixodes scapularis]